MIDPNLITKVWEALLQGTPPVSLGLSSVDGRVDLRGLSAVEPSVSNEFATPMANVRRLAGLTEVRGVHWKGIDFSRARLDSLRFLECTIEDCNFERASCRDWRMWGTTISSCAFRAADLKKAALGGVEQGRRNSFRDLDFSKTDLRGTAHQSADMIGCRFVGTKLTKVDFQGTVFVDCVFEGELRDVQFARYAFQGESFPANEMKGVDFRRAKLRDVMFRKLDMTDVRWPEDPDHIVVADYKPTLSRMLTVLSDRDDVPARKLRALFELALKWAGPNQRQGVLNKQDLLEAGDPDLAEKIVHECRTGVN